MNGSANRFASSDSDHGDPTTPVQLHMLAVNYKVHLLRLPHNTARDHSSSSELSAGATAGATLGGGYSPDAGSELLAKAIR